MLRIGLWLALCVKGRVMVRNRGQGLWLWLGRTNWVPVWIVPLTTCGSPSLLCFFFSWFLLPSGQGYFCHGYELEL